MRPKVFTLTAPGYSPPHRINYKEPHLNVTFSCKITGTALYTVEHTFDDIGDPNVVLSWWPNEFIENEITDQYGDYLYPIQALRLHVVSLSNGGTVSMTVLQGN